MTRRDGPSGARRPDRTLGRPTHRAASAPVLPRDGSRIRDVPDDDAPFERRLGYCYVLANRFMWNHPDAILVHGSIAAFGMPRLAHAWVMSADGSVWEPITNALYESGDFLAMFNPKAEARYTANEAARAALLSNNHGPWHHSSVTKE